MVIAWQSHRVRVVITWQSCEYRVIITRRSSQDIDVLLARGEERTRADNEKLQKTKNNLANFSIGDEESNLYEFEGQDYSAAVRSKGPWSLNLPKRSTKQNYDENEYYRSMLNKDAGPRGPRAPKQLQVPKCHSFRARRLSICTDGALVSTWQVSDFQFFDIERLEELREKEARRRPPTSPPRYAYSLHFPRLTRTQARSPSPAIFIDS